MTRFLIACFAALFLVACAGERPPEKAILGDWVQDAPTSTTQDGISAVTAVSEMSFEKDGDVRLYRLLELSGKGLPETGVVLEVNLSGTWSLREGQLVQSPSGASVTPRDTDPIAVALAEQLQSEAATSGESVKTIIVLDRKQLILQDDRTGVTDSYRRK